MPEAKAPPSADQLQDFAMRQAAATGVLSAQPRTETVGSGSRWSRHGNPPPKAKPMVGPAPKPPPEPENRKRAGA
eukprot:15477603-Alexandrium_andersonii.AAC.1